MQHMEEMKHEPSQSPSRTEIPANGLAAALAVKQVQDRSQQISQSMSALDSIAVPVVETISLPNSNFVSVTLVETTVAASEQTEKSTSTSEKTTQTDFNTQKTTGTGKDEIDEDIREAFQQQTRFRLYILRMEQKFTQFIRDSTSDELVCPAASPYERRLTHKLADFFMLDHMTDSPNACVKVLRSERTRIPEKTVAAAIGIDNESSNTLPQPRILRRNISSTVASDRESNRTRSPDRMSKTSSTSREDAATISTNASSTTPSIVEKKDAYEAARARIFADFSELSLNKKGSQQQRLSGRSSAQSSDDDFSVRSSYQLMPATSNPDVYSWLGPVAAAESQTTWRHTPPNKDTRSQSSTPQSHNSDASRLKSTYTKKQEMWQPNSQPQPPPQLSQHQFGNISNTMYPNHGVFVGAVPNQAFNVPIKSHVQGPFLIAQPGYIVVPGHVPVYPLQATYQGSYIEPSYNNFSNRSTMFTQSANHGVNIGSGSHIYPQQMPVTSHPTTFMPQTVYHIENVLPSNGYMSGPNYTMAPPIPVNPCVSNPAIGHTPPPYYQTNSPIPRPQISMPWQQSISNNAQGAPNHHASPAQQIPHGDQHTLPPRPIIPVKEPVGVELDGVVYYDRKQKQEYEAASGRKLGS